MTDLTILNSEQTEAVKDFSHNLLLLACAGSGKTKTITNKIAYAIENRIVTPYEVCAVTFTNRAAREMRERVSALIPEVDTSKMMLRTFHSLGAYLLRLYSQDAGLSSDFCIYDDDDSLSLLSTVSKADKKYLRRALHDIATAKDLGLEPDSLSLSEVSDLPDFSELYRKYQNALDATGNVDFADLIGKAKRLLKNPRSSASSYCHRRFRLVLVDEYQDSNKEQFEFLKAFVGENTQLVVVGDDDQSIYSFRGAKIDNILDFANRFDNVREIKLEKNYRSTNEILRPAGALIKKNTKRHDKEIISADNKSGPKPELAPYPNDSEEAYGVVNTIYNLGKGEWNSTAILYRTNAQSLLFEQTLQKQRIPYKIVGALKFYEREEVKDGLALLYLLMNSRDTVSFRRVINKPTRGLGPKKVEEIISYSDDLFEGLREFSRVNSNKAGQATSSFLGVFEEANRRLDDGEIDLGNLLSFLLIATGIKGLYEGEKDRAVRDTKLENLSALVNALAKAGCGREALREFLETITLDTTTLGDQDSRDEEGVTLITMHNTKGLEYDNVFCVGLEEELIPGRNSEDISSLEEERRILYVAMTRARKRLYLSYAAQRMLWGSYSTQMMSEFISEIPSEMLNGSESIKKNHYSSSYGLYSAKGSSNYFDNPPYYYSSTKNRSAASNRNAQEFGIKITTSSFEAPKPVKRSEGEPKRRFEIGERVISSSYGEGIVENAIIQDSTGDRILTVRFATRTIKFKESVAQIEKLS